MVGMGYVQDYTPFYHKRIVRKRKVRHSNFEVAITFGFISGIHISGIPGMPETKHHRHVKISAALKNRNRSN